MNGHVNSDVTDKCNAHIIMEAIHNPDCRQLFLLMYTLLSFVAFVWQASKQVINRTQQKSFFHAIHSMIITEEDPFGIIHKDIL